MRLNIALSEKLSGFIIPGPSKRPFDQFILTLVNDIPKNRIDLPNLSSMQVKDPNANEIVDAGEEILWRDIELLPIVFAIL